MFASKPKKDVHLDKRYQHNVMNNAGIQWSKDELKRTNELLSCSLYKQNVLASRIPDDTKI